MLGIEAGILLPLRRAGDRDHGRGLSRPADASGPRSSAGRAPRRRASAARWRRASACWPSIVTQAKEDNTSWVSAEDAFKLHDTYGFPYEMTKELLAEEGLSVDDQGFEELMERAREVSRQGSSRTRARARAAPRCTWTTRTCCASPSRPASRRASWATRPPRRTPSCAWPSSANGWVLAKLEESPFYPEGGGQVSDSGVAGDAQRPRAGGRRVPPRRRPGARARAARGRAGPGAERDRQRGARPAPGHDAQPHRHPPAARRAARAARHARAPGRLLRGPRQAALRLHPRRAALAGGAGRRGEHGVGLDRRQPPGARDRDDQATRPSGSGAMALFGEKYGDWVRMVEIEDVSRELCGGTHVAATAELGLFHLTSETSSASNVRRIEALTGPAGAELFRERSERLRELAALLQVPEHEVVRAVERLSERVKELQRKPAGGPDRDAADELVERRRRAGRRARGGGGGRRARTRRRCSSSPTPCARGSATPRWCWARAVDGRVHLVANVAPAVVERGVKAGDGGPGRGPGGGRRRRRARHDGAGRRPRSRQAARGARRRARGDREGARADGAGYVALDHGSARCGCAISDPTGTLATPLGAVERPDTKKGLAALARLVEQQGAERVVVGLPLTLRGEEGDQAARGARVCRAARAESQCPGGAARRAPDHEARRAQRGPRGCRLAGRRASARELSRRAAVSRG